MRKLVLAAALSGTMLTLAACSGAADETTDAADTAEVEATEDAAAVSLSPFCPFRRPGGNSAFSSPGPCNRRSM
ncbi:MAG: hypothetical protein VX719_02665 [Pseudomonadota bacterium]|nr:hypothetical protein [Pseudomonadota bacterium]